ncbi:MFS transporter [Sphingomonas oryzagri]
MLFASGDFACNLYWQSQSFYLLFFTTTVLKVPIAAAGAITLVTSLWHGAIGVPAGLAADHADNRFVMQVAVVPLALSFALIYWPMPFAGAGMAWFALFAQILFRTLYAAVNIPYAALTVRVSAAQVDRSRIAGLRMLLGAAAAGVIALGTRRAVEWAGGQCGYAAIALIAGLVATPVLLWVSATRSIAAPASRGTRMPGLGPAFGVLLRDSRFLRLNLGICGCVAAASTLSRSVPFFFRYVMHDDSAAASTLSLMGIAGVVSVPFWMACAARFGHRVQWGLSCILGAIAMIALLLRLMMSQASFVLFQFAASGLFFGFWSLLPAEVERVGREAGRGMDALLYAIAELLQRVADGLAAVVLGWMMAATGWGGSWATASSATGGMEWVVGCLPLTGMVLASIGFLRPQNREDQL